MFLIAVATAGLYTAASGCYTKAEAGSQHGNNNERVYVDMLYVTTCVAICVRVAWSIQNGYCMISGVYLVVYVCLCLEAQHRSLRCPPYSTVVWHGMAKDSTQVVYTCIVCVLDLFLLYYYTMCVCMGACMCIPLRAHSPHSFSLNILSFFF